MTTGSSYFTTSPVFHGPSTPTFQAPLLKTAAFSVSVQVSSKQRVHLWRFFRNVGIALLMVMPYVLSF